MQASRPRWKQRQGTYTTRALLLLHQPTKLFSALQIDLRQVKRRKKSQESDD
uniref:Uncharacterized protein n=1 Tax=Arundo donax TaxID=35708 RepID=A0A0A9GJC0_ARUDO